MKKQLYHIFKLKKEKGNIKSVFICKCTFCVILWAVFLNVLLLLLCLGYGCCTEGNNQIITKGRTHRGCRFKHSEHYSVRTFF